MGFFEMGNKPGIEQRLFGTTIDGKKITQYKLTNKKGMSVGIINYGGTITNMVVPDKNGRFGDVILGLETIGDYEKDTNYFGGVIGRYANRIAHGRFSLDGKPYELSINNNGNTLHGGRKGFNKQVWQAKTVENTDGLSVVLNYQSPDGEEGYPGNLKCEVTFTLNHKNTVRIQYKAQTDAPTLVNLTDHTYFNLTDGGKSSVLDHQIQINASQYTPMDQRSIPTGELIKVEDSPFDFRKHKAIRTGINTNHEQLQIGRGYDHNFVLNKPENQLGLAASVVDPVSGRVLEVFTSEPGVQFYSGNFLDGKTTGKNGTAYQHRTGLCLETQHFPDSPNQPNFPSTVLRPGETFKSVTEYRFKVNQ